MVLIILGAIAAVATLAALTWAVVRQLLTKPKVRLEFVNDVSRAILGCEFYNDPLSQWPLSFFNIKRQDIDEFWALAHLFNLDTGQQVCELLDTALHDRRGNHDNTLPLPASAHCLYWPIVSFEEDLDGPCAMASIDDKPYRMLLGPGTYEIAIFIHADEVDVGYVVQRFVVGSDKRVLAWVGKPQRLKARNLLRRLLSTLAEKVGATRAVFAR